MDQGRRERTANSASMPVAFSEARKPGDLPVMMSSKFEFLINPKTAKTLGLTVPLTLQAAADQVVE